MPHENPPPKPKQPSVRELGPKWLEASSLNQHTQKLLSCSLEDYVSKHNLWDLTAKELWLNVTDIDPEASIWIMANSDDPVPYVDFSAIPKSEWDEYEYQNAVIPPQFWERLQSKKLTVHELEDIAEEIEKFYGFSERYFLSPSHQFPYYFSLWIDTNFPE